MIKAAVKSYTLNFAQPAGTSRGVYKTRKSWFVILRSADKVGVGECAPLPNLSCDDIVNYEEVLVAFCRRIEEGTLLFSELASYPSMLFGIETALRDLQSTNHTLWDTPFTRGEHGITINGLVWMGTHDFMLEQIDAKIEKGFRCLKLKVGAIDFEQELDLIRHIRMRYAKSDLTIRLDANGGFSESDALEKLHLLSVFDIHSIEQPIKAGNAEAMASLVAKTPIPIALDEELIGVNTLSRKQMLLDAINPHFIILKPSLHGGIVGSTEWIEEADKRHVGWWITSALESNVGLNAIAQWTASLGVAKPQGLGTGMLFTNNFTSPLYIMGDELRYGMPCGWNLSELVK